MAQYKVPQDVEADDKLLGPFTFRQFIYLMITVGSIGLAFALFKVFPFLAIIPIPFVLFFGILALPLKKDQPMETYLAAIVSFHIKPRTRVWNPGQRESTIIITAPKQQEAPRARSISGEEASTRLSFLAGVVDSEGYSIRGDNSQMHDDFLAENLDTQDMLDGYSSSVINQMINREQQKIRSSAANQMRQAFSSAAPQNVQPLTNAQAFSTPTLPANYQGTPTPQVTPPQTTQSTPSIAAQLQQRSAQPTNAPQAAQPAPVDHTRELTALANNTTATVDYLARKANEITGDNEVYVSLH